MSAADPELRIHALPVADSGHGTWSTLEAARFLEQIALPLGL